MLCVIGYIERESVCVINHRFVGSPAMPVVVVVVLREKVFLKESKQIERCLLDKLEERRQRKTQVNKQVNNNLLLLL